MNAEIIAVGTELLLGQIVNTNAAFLSQQLATLGIDVYHQVVVGDNPTRLKEVIKIAEQRSDLLILTGGLGPTKDDLTKQVLAEHLNKELVLDSETMANITDYHKKMNRTMTENNRMQALVIEGAMVLKNPNGLAAGMFIKHNEQAYLLFPGPPHELKAMFVQEAKPILLSYADKEDVLMSRVMRFFGIGESRLVTLLDDLIETQTNPTLASYAGVNEVSVRLTANGRTETDCQKLLDDLEGKIQDRVGDYLYGYGEETRLVEVVGELIKKQQLTLTAAESLTGGAFQSMLTTTAGVSEYFEGGVVTYSNRIKEDILGVSKETIEQYGVVSAHCAIEMAQCVKNQFGTDIGVSFTGVAGPAELEGQKSGTVWIGYAFKDTVSYAKCFHFGKGRNSNREQAVLSALDMIRRELLGKPIEGKTYLKD